VAFLAIASKGRILQITAIWSLWQTLGVAYYHWQSTMTAPCLDLDATQRLKYDPASNFNNKIPYGCQWENTLTSKIYQAAGDGVSPPLSSK